jgi:hypothetical protein
VCVCPDILLLYSIQQLSLWLLITTFYRWWQHSCHHLLRLPF